MRLGLVVAVLAAMWIGGCASMEVAAPSADPRLAALTNCEEAFRAWVQNAEALNEPDSDFTGLLVGGERIQRRVFELCSLAEAERFNQEIQLTNPIGSEPMIQPDFRTFAEIECVDESPLLDGTPLCSEVRR